MRNACWIGLLTLALASAFGGALAEAAAASSRQQQCAVELRVNVFGPSSPESNWALRGGLNAGKLATLRARARGCNGGVAEIRGRWVSGGAGAIPTTQCGSAICFVRARSGRQSAADFQALARAPGGATVRSNIVRVAWAGSSTAAGTWEQTTPGIGLTTFWTIMPGGRAQEAGGGSAAGMATRAGRVLRITFVAADGVTRGVYEWNLTPGGGSGTGTLRFTGPASRVGETHTSTVRRRGG